MKTFKSKKENPHIQTQGFTIIETLVAISILTISILSGFTAVQNGLKASMNSKDQITAFYLIQDVMEYVKNIRDENGINYIRTGTGNWLANLSAASDDPCYFGNTCYIDTTKLITNNAAVRYNGVNTSAPVLNMNAAGLFGYEVGGTSTSFRRMVSLQSISSTEIAVTVWIGWTQGGDAKSFQVTQHLFNHH